MTVVKPLNIADARIGFRNFEGREGLYNKSGDRSFVVFLDDETAKTLFEEGWNVKFPKEREGIDPEEDDRSPHLQVSVSFDNYPANVFLISNDNPTRLDESEVSMLDWAELSNVDLVIRPYTWEVNGKSGIKAYLKAGYFTIITDMFAAKYGV